MMPTLLSLVTQQIVITALKTQVALWPVFNVVTMPTLLTPVTPEVVMPTTSGVTSDDKVGIMTTLSSQRRCPWWHFYSEYFLNNKPYLYTKSSPFLDSFTVPLHCPNGRQMPAVGAVQRDCHWGLENRGNSHCSHEPIMQWGTRQSQSIFRCTNHKRVMPDNWRPCLLPHWESYCHRVRTV